MMLASLTFDPMMFADRPAENRSSDLPAAQLTATLLDEVQRVEGTALDHPPFLFRCAEAWGLAVVAGSAACVVSGLAALAG